MRPITDAHRSLPPVDASRPDLIFCADPSAGWGPIEHFARMAARLLEMNLRRPVRPRPRRSVTLKHSLRRAARGSAPGVLYLANVPSSVKSLIAFEDFNAPRRFRALWIVDSFQTEWAPSARLVRSFDLVIYMQKAEAKFYERLAPGRTLYLPWGADVLDLGSNASERPVDVLRVGRQPYAWDDDTRSRAACEALGLTFAGRPPYVEDTAQDPSAGHRALCAHYSTAKFVIAHSNLVSPASYTHPTKEYITGRWTDSLAAGARVAGIHPFTDTSSEDLFWPGATLTFDRIDLAHNVEALREAVACWTPQVVAHNRREALQRLDWRWRLKAVADRLDVGTPALQADLARLNATLKNAL